MTYLIFYTNHSLEFLHQFITQVCILNLLLCTLCTYWLWLLYFLIYSFSPYLFFLWNLFVEEPRSFNLQSATLFNIFLCPMTSYKLAVGSKGMMGLIPFAYLLVVAVFHEETYNVWFSLNFSCFLLLSMSFLL